MSEVEPRTFADIAHHAEQVQAEVHEFVEHLDGWASEDVLEHGALLQSSLRLLERLAAQVSELADRCDAQVEPSPLALLIDSLEHRAIPPDEPVTPSA